MTSVKGPFAIFLAERTKPNDGPHVLNATAGLEGGSPPQGLQGETHCQPLASLHKPESPTRTLVVQAVGVYLKEKHLARFQH